MEDPRDQGAGTAPSLAWLFIPFARLGLTAFGGPAMIPYIRRMVVEQKRWISEQAFRHGLALSQSIPGSTALQICAYTGVRTRGVAGAAVSFVGFGLPAFVLMLALSALYARAYDLHVVVSIFSGLQAVIVAIVANAAVLFGRDYLKHWKDVGIAGLAGIAFGFGINPFLVVLSAAILGIIAYTSEHLPRPAAEEGHYYPMRSLLLLLAGTLAGFVLLYVFQRQLFDLAIVMFGIGLFAYGGGFGAAPLLYHQVVEVEHWMTGSTFLNGVTLSQITPGPILVTSTFVGYLLYGLVGATIATAAIFLPSFLLMVAAAPYFGRLARLPHFVEATRGILVSFVGLLLSVTVTFALQVSWDISHLLLAVAAFVALRLKVEILWVVLAAAIVSVLVL